MDWAGRWIRTALAVSVVTALAVFPSDGRCDETTDTLLEQFETEYKPIEPLIPPQATFERGFEEGETALVGSMQEVHGNVYVYHQGQLSVYRLEKDHPVYQGDTLVASTRSRASVKLRDGSAFALAPSSKLVIDKSVYNPETRKRSSFLKLLFGRARFYIAKLRGETDYRVGTPTAVCGLRGSDFALAVFPYEEKTSWLENLVASMNPVSVAHAQDPTAVLATVVCTGEQTTITFTGLIGPLQNLGPIQLSWAPPGMAASGPIPVTLGAVMEALNAVGPNLAAISMPPGAEASAD